MKIDMSRLPHRVRKTYWNTRKKFSKSNAKAMPKYTINLSGKEFMLPQDQTHLFDFSTDHEKWLNPIFSAIQTYKAGAFLDVGVNRGQTLAKFLSVSPDRAYVGFEPQPACASFMQEFFRINHLVDCNIVPVGLSDANKIARLYFHSGRPGDSTASITEAHRPSSFYSRFSLIPIFRGDDVMSELDVSDISVVKIDVEGAELEVIWGMRNTISRFRPFLVFEVLNNYLVVTGEALPQEIQEYRNQRASEISSTLQGLGYNIYNIRGKTLHQRQKIQPEVSSDLSITDYLAIPKEIEENARPHFSKTFKFRKNSQTHVSA